MTEPHAQSSWAVGAGDEVRRRAEQRRAVAEAIGHSHGQRPRNSQVPAASLADPVLATGTDQEPGLR